MHKKKATFLLAIMTSICVSTAVPSIALTQTPIITAQTLKTLKSKRLTAKQLLKGWQLCNVAYNDCKRLVGTKSALIAKQQELLKEQAKQLNTDTGLFRSPVFWFIMGVVTFGVATKLVK